MAPAGGFLGAVADPERAEEATIWLHTKLDAAFGILGCLLIVSGLALSVLGGAYRRWATSMSSS